MRPDTTADVFPKTPSIHLALTTMLDIQIGKIVRQSQPKFCDLDPIPTTLLKSCLLSQAPVITPLVNLSIIHSKVPSALKTAFVTPIPKRQGMNEGDREVLRNYRPFTNLPFSAKVLERVRGTATIASLISAPTE